MLYRRGKVWWFRIKSQGHDIRRSTGTCSKELARRIEIQALNEIAAGRWFEKDPAETVLFSQVWERYLREEAQYRAMGTYSRAIQSAKNFLPHIGDLTLTQITPSVLSGYKAKRLGDGVKASTVVKELQFIRRVFSLCKREWELIKQSPFEIFRMPKVSDQRVRFLDTGEFEKLLNNCPSWLRPMVVLARYTGMRRGNIISLTWSQVDLKSRIINLEHTKNGQRLTLPLTDTAYDALVALKREKVTHISCPYVLHHDGHPYAPYQVSMAFKRACKRSGIENFRFHDLRHDFASSLVQKGCDLYVVQHLLGHRDGRMTQRYAHLRLENLRTAVETLEEDTEGHKKGHSGNEKEAANIATP